VLQIAGWRRGDCVWLQLRGRAGAVPAERPLPVFAAGHVVRGGADIRQLQWSRSQIVFSFRQLGGRACVGLHRRRDAGADCGRPLQRLPAGGRMSEALKTVGAGLVGAALIYLLWML